ncbi:hypothetical protein [Taibaiella soli]|uniref:Uncharacterized protein n=1 Tax=Taibaiella soli TaxID=1649169 RepID=A0A2W2AY32_9BACT|nr:hypothetical protein [Taibaiella soli]PZF72598.1 hypothetical protein DN068_12085 [Taibaiella soli]
MNTDDIINNALSNGGGILNGSGLWVLEGNVNRNEFRIIPLKEAYIDGFMVFKFGIETGNIILGVFDKPEAAEYYRDWIRSVVRSED